MARCNYITVISTKEAFREGSWVITSDDLPGLFLVGENLSDLRDTTPTAIKLLYKLNYDMEVDVRPTMEPKQARRICNEGAKIPRPKGWAAVPIAA